jgi:predicted RND superfamily exporter protein
MGFTGMPLGVATSMFCAIALGIGVDYAIHLMEQVRAARARGEDDPVVAALGACAAPIATDTLAIALGFGLLLVSRVPANARLGALVALSLLSACVLTLGGLGVVLRGRGAGDHAASGPAPAEER